VRFYKAAAGALDTHRTISIDEMTGIQALERAAPGLPMAPHANSNTSAMALRP